MPTVLQAIPPGTLGCGWFRALEISFSHGKPSVVLAYKANRQYEHILRVCRHFDSPSDNQRGGGLG